MNNYYTNMLLNGMSHDDTLAIQDIPLIINTTDTSYLLAFIDYEEDDKLGINYTAEDGTERFVVVNKKYIVDVEVLYQQDIDILFTESDDEDTDSSVMYQ